MTEKSHGRHRTPGRYNPLSELALIASRASSPAIKTSAVLAASGGLVAAFAIPANAGGKVVSTPLAAPADGASALVSISGRASEVAASRAAARPALTAPAVAAPSAVPAFGKMTFTAVEKPPPPPPPPVVTPAASPSTSSASSAGGSGTSSRSSSTSSSTAPAPANDAPTRVASGGVLAVAASLTGIPYLYGGTTPAGFDCSGFTQYVYAHFGVYLPRSSSAQGTVGVKVARSEAQPGDLLWWPGHVGIYTGNGNHIAARNPGTPLSEGPIWDPGYTVIRVL